MNTPKRAKFLVHSFLLLKSIYLRHPLRWLLVKPIVITFLLCSCGGQPENPDNNNGNAGNPPGNNQNPNTNEPNTRPYTLGSPLVRRLTREEYVYTIKDAFNIDLSEQQKNLLPKERSLSGFRNSATTQTVVSEHIESYQKLAQEIVDQIDFNAYLAEYAPCAETKQVSPDCAQTFINNVGRELFRRPLETSEINSLNKILDVSKQEGFNFAEGAKTLTYAMLQFPAFIYRLEVEYDQDNNANQARRLNSYELASRLSYFIWSSQPDSDLLAVAEKDELQTNQQILAQTERMLKDAEKVQRSTQRYLWDWLKLTGVVDAQASLRDALIDQYQTQVWQKKLPLFNLLTNQELHLPEDWAVQAGLREPLNNSYQYPVFDTRTHPGLVGLFAHPATLLAMVSSDDAEHPFIHRGLYLHQRLFCGDEIPSPPESLRTSIDEFSDNLPEDISLREEADQLHAVPQCGFCHKLFEPLAFPFEPYDIEAHFQNQDKHGNSVRTDGTLSASMTGSAQQQSYKNIVEYMDVVANSPKVRRCMIENHLRFALGRELEDQEKPAVSELLQQLENSNGTYSDLVRAIVTHKSFTEVLVQ